MVTGQSLGTSRTYMLSGLLSAHRPAAKPVADDRLEGIDLFEVIVTEVHTAALQIAAVASAVNALDPKGLSPLAYTFATLIPRVPQVAVEMKRCQQELDLPQEVAPAVDLLGGNWRRRGGYPSFSSPMPVAAAQSPRSGGIAWRSKRAGACWHNSPSMPLTRWSRRRDGASPGSIARMPCCWQSC